MELEIVHLADFNQPLIKHKDRYYPSASLDLLKIKDFVIRPDDTFIIGFPKSGTTWLKEIVWLIQNNLDYDKSLATPHYLRVPLLDKAPLKNKEELASPRVIKTHLLPEYLPEKIEKLAKVIYIMRNPKDLIVSFYNFIKWTEAYKYTGSFERVVDDFCEKRNVNGDWSTNLNQWFNKPEILYISYEDLLEKSLETVKLIAKFLGKDYSDEQLKELINYTSFSNMKNNASYRPDKNHNQDYLNLFFRKGQIGNWKEHINTVLEQKIDNYVRNNLNPNIKIRYHPINQN